MDKSDSERLFFGLFVFSHMPPLVFQNMSSIVCACLKDRRKRSILIYSKAPTLRQCPQNKLFCSKLFMPQHSHNHVKFTTPLFTDSYKRKWHSRLSATTACPHWQQTARRPGEDVIEHARDLVWKKSRSIFKWPSNR